MRLVEFWEWEVKKHETGGLMRVKGPLQTGWFHAIGVNYEEFESGPGNFSTMIIERDDGILKSVPVQNCRFVTGPNPRRQ